MSYVDTFKQVLLKPAEAFAAAKKESGFGNALTYWGISLVITLALTAATLYFVGNAVGGMMAAMGLNIPGMTAIATGFSVVVLVGQAVNQVIGLFGVAFLASFGVNAIGGKTDFNQTFRMMAYSQVPIMPLAAIPFVGLLFALYGIYVFYKGLTTTYGFDTGKAIVAFILFIVAGIAVSFASSFVTTPAYSMMGL